MIISGMTSKDITKNICSCNIKECPLKKKSEKVFDIIETSPLELTQLRLNKFIHEELKTFLMEIININNSLTQCLVDLFCSQHPGFVLSDFDF